MTTNGHRVTDPTIAARGGVEAPLAPVLARRTGLRGRAGLIAVAVGAVVIVAAGMGLGGPAPVLDPRATATTTTASDASGSRSPDPAAAGPTKLPGSGCLPVDPADLPELRLASTSGERGGRRGSEPSGSTATGSDSTADWPVPGPSSAVALGVSASLVLVPEESACVRRATVEVVGMNNLGDPPIPLGPGDIALNPPRARVVLAGLPSGDWVVRVVARYATGDPAIAEMDLPVIERFFRVASAERPAVTPLITPTVPCGDPPRGGLFPPLLLAVGDGEPVRGINVTTFPGSILPTGALVSGSFPDPVELRIEGDVCATSWAIDVLDPVQGNIYIQLAQDNPLENPAYVSENRIILTNLPLGRSVVRATVAFQLLTVHVAWELEIAGPPTPGATFGRADGTEVAGLPGCGTNWWLETGASAFELCPIPNVPDQLNVLTVRDGEVVTVDLPGWTIENWSGACGERGAMPGELVQVAFCSLGGQGDGVGPAGPARFVPFPGRTIAWLWLSAEKDGVRIGAQYFVEIVVEP